VSHRQDEREDTMRIAGIVAAGTLAITIHARPPRRTT
jgi:hypothetical protein